MSAGTEPGTRVHAEVVTVMKEIGIDLSHAPTTRLTDELAQQAQIIVTMGCGDRCPIARHARRDDWPLDDPYGKTVDQVRALRDVIRERVESLIRREGWQESLPASSSGTPY